MKCENCGKNEANFVYRSNINGRTEEHYLCQDCAEKLGYTRRFFDQRPSIMDSFFGNNSFFSSMPSLMGRMLESPFDDFFDEMPAIGAAPVQEVQKERKDNLMSCEDQSRFSYLRQMNALKHAQKQAIDEEDFERAAQLRDEIHKLEEIHKETEASEKDDKEHN
jgi:protein arginine kinase activator